MEQQLEVILTGSDMAVDGIARKISFEGQDNAWEFESLDGSLNLIIARDADGNWQRLAGTEPYLSSWVDELASQIF